MSQDVIFGEDIQDSEERVGGGFTADETHIATVFFTEAFITESEKGALAANLYTKDKEGNERRYQVYFTNRNKEVFYTDKRTHNKVKLPGYQLLDAMCLATCGKPFAEVFRAAKLKTIDLYDFESRKDVPTEVKSLSLMLKKPLKLGVIKLVKNKFKNGKPINERSESNEIDKAFRVADNLTPIEHGNGVTEPKVYNKWVKYWADPQRVKDEYKEVEEEETDSDGVNPFGGSDSDTDDSDLFGSESDTSTESTDAASPAEPETGDDEEDDPFGN